MKFVPFLVVAAAMLSPLSGEALDLANLATGYAKAFECSGKSSISIVYQTPSNTETIAEVNDVKAVESVLLIKTFNGTRQILDPARIVKMTTN